MTLRESRSDPLFSRLGWDLVMEGDRRPLFSASSFVTVEGMLYSWQELRQRLTISQKLPTVMIDIFRGGESNTANSGRVSGSKDVPLSMKGERQAKRLASELMDWYDLAYTSRLKRTQNTLDIALAQGFTSVGEIEKDERLDSRDYGQLELGPHEAITTYNDADITRVPPGGESNLDVAQRILSFIVDLQMEVAQRDGDKPVKVLLCTHASPMRMVLGIVRQLATAEEVSSLEYGNCELVREYLPPLTFPRFLERASLVVDSDRLGHQVS